MKFFVSCAKGLEYLLADELSALGLGKATATIAGVNTEGELEQALRIVMWSRLASRVLWPIDEFDCPDEQALYDGVRALPWHEHIKPEMTLAVDAHVSGDKITHARFAAQRIKDAIVDRMRDEGLERPSVNTDLPDVRVNLSLRKGRASLSIDLGGGPLHRRGWRGAAHEAPLKENLAAALLLRAQWPRLHAAGGGLLDPMCGSGTLLIEGALMAADVAPGLMRHGSLPPSRWLGFDKSAWKTIQSEARDREAAGLAALKPVIHGSDIDPTAIQAARENAEVAGVAHAIRFTRADVADLAAPEQEIGAVVCNPPYDERLAADPALYRALGNALQKAVPQWRASLLCGNDELAFATGLRAGKKYQMFNGALECALIVCDPIAVPGRDPAQPRELSEGAQMVANRLRKNLKKFKSWRAREDITCFRAYDADLPEYAAAIDVYEEDGGKRRTFLHVQEYAAPAAIPENDVRRRRNELLAAAREVFGVPPEQVSMKSRERGKGGSKYGRFEQRDEFIVVRENNALLQVNLFDYLDTGLFLDHRPLRRMMAEQVRGKRFLNLFCYTGVASVQAAVAGAASTTSVDLSATYLQWCYDNLALNGQGGNQHLLVQADAMAWLEGDRGQYDVIFCDPPTFSNSARADDFDVQREQLKLLRAAVARLARGRAVLLEQLPPLQAGRKRHCRICPVPRDHRAHHRPGLRTQRAHPSRVGAEAVGVTRRLGSEPLRFAKGSDPGGPVTATPPAARPRAARPPAVRSISVGTDTTRMTAPRRPQSSCPATAPGRSPSRGRPRTVRTLPPAVPSPVPATACAVPGAAALPCRSCWCFSIASDSAVNAENDRVSASSIMRWPPLRPLLQCSPMPSAQPQRPHASSSRPHSAVASSAACANRTAPASRRTRSSTDRSQPIPSRRCAGCCPGAHAWSAH